MGFMEWMAYLGISTIIYSIFKAVVMGPDDEDKKPPLPVRILSKLGVPILILSLPAWLIIGASDEFWTQRVYRRRCKDMRKAIFIAGCTARPTDAQIASYGLDCAGYTDSYGKFELYQWQRHEYEKLGL